MADPFSITGSAVGVVSLAIQLCKGLEWYVSGVKDANDKAEQIAAETEELTNLLNLLETIVTKVDLSQSVSTTLTGIASCAEAIVTIRKKLKLDDPVHNGGIKSSFKRLGKRMAFPFKEAEIEYWKSVLNTIQQNLQTALLALVIDQQRLASEDVRLRFTQLSMDQTAQHHSNLQLQRIVFDKTQLQLVGHSQVLERGFTATSHSIRSLHADVNHIQDTLQPIMSLPRLESTLERLDAKLSEVTSTIDSTLETDMMNLKSLVRKDRNLKQRLAKARCTCQTHTSALGYRLGWLALAYTRTSIHDPRCPVSSLQKSVTNLQFRATLCSLILRSRVSLSLTLACGTGFSVKQSLTCHRVVADSSPAFSLIPGLVRSVYNTTEEVFRDEVDRLLEIFQQGQASPHDRTADGYTLLHELGYWVHDWEHEYTSSDYIKNLRYIYMTLLARMSTDAFETDSSGSTCLDLLIEYPWNRQFEASMHISKVLFTHGLQITQHTLDSMVLTSYTSILYAGFSAEDSTDPWFDDSDLLEATILRSDRQLRQCLHQSKDSQTLDAQTVTYALGLATTTGWANGCKIMLEADVMTNLNGDYERPTYFTLLGSSAGTNRLEMVQLWLSQRADFDSLQLDLIGYAEDMLDGHECRILSEYSKEILRDVAFYLSNLRQEIRLFVEKHKIEYCCESARNNPPDAHLGCMLNALVNKGIKVPQHYWPKRKSLYHRTSCWCYLGRLIFDSYENDGFCEISGKNYRCSMETSCSPLMYFLTTQTYGDFYTRGALTERDLTVRWFISRGADLRETWPGSRITALHCLAWQTANHIKEYHEDILIQDKRPMAHFWEHRAFDSFVQEGVLDHCQCGCSSSGCNFLTCFWKTIFSDTSPHPRFSLPAICDLVNFGNLKGEVRANAPSTPSQLADAGGQSVVLLELANWVDDASHTLKLCSIFHEYIRLFVFSYLELRHTCCDISCLHHDDDPKYNVQPYPRYTPKEERRIKDEDAKLHDILEELVPKFISQFDDVGGKLGEFVLSVMIPKMREVAGELKEEDRVLYAEGRRKLGIVMYEDEDDAEKNDSGEGDEEEAEEDTEEESDDE